MSRKNQDLIDFDENCDAENPKSILMEDVYKALDRTKKYVINTPCMASHYQKDFGINIYYKMETLHRTGSFKERGIINALDILPLDKKKIGVVMASLGNAATALCYYGAKLGIPVIVVIPTTVPVGVLQKCYVAGAKVYIQGNTLIEAQRYARAIARDKGLTYINGRDHPDMLAGYATMGLEIADQLPYIDAVLLPVGCGGLLAAVGTALKTLKPDCLVYGIQTETMPAFQRSLENGEMTAVACMPTMAAELAVTNVGVNAFFAAQGIVDRMVLVSENAIARATLHLLEKERLVVDGAGALPLAAIMDNLVPELKLKNVVCVLSGGNVDSVMLPRYLERGLAAEGRLVKFKVSIKDSSQAQAELFKYLSACGFNVVHQFQEHRWMEKDVYKMEVQLACVAKNLEHGLELKRLIEKAYPCRAMFDTAPFNDKRTCPCYVHKPIPYSSL